MSLDSELRDETITDTGIEVFGTFTFKELLIGGAFAGEVINLIPQIVS